MQKDSQHTDSSLYRFLTTPEFRAVRHAVLIVTLLLISLSQTSYSFTGTGEASSMSFYIAATLSGLLYLAVTYLHIYGLVPHFLTQGKLGSYLIYSFLSVLGLVVMSAFIETTLSQDTQGFPLVSYNLVGWLNLLSEFTLNMLCITGVTVTVLLKKWLEQKEKVHQLEQKQVRAEVEKFRDQINPGLLLSTLRKTSAQVRQTDTDISGTLFLLSELLRYQLYDCNRDKVVTTTEVRFLENYLQLLQSTFGTFTYTFRVTGDPRRVFTPPLLFFPFIQEAVSHLRETASGTVHLDITIELSEHPYTLRIESSHDLATVKDSPLIRKKQQVAIENDFRVHYIQTEKGAAQ